MGKAKNGRASSFRPAPSAAPTPLKGPLPRSRGPVAIRTFTKGKCAHVSRAEKLFIQQGCAKMLQTCRGGQGKPRKLLATASSSRRSVQLQKSEKSESSQRETAHPPLPSGPGAGAHLDKTDVLGVLTEALPAHIQTVLANEAVAVGADAAVREEGKQGRSGRVMAAGRGREKRRDRGSCGGPGAPKTTRTALGTRTDQEREPWPNFLGWLQ